VRVTRQQNGQRALELAVAVLTGLMGLFLLVMSVGGLLALLVSRPFDWKATLAALVGGAVGVWCAQTSWRLVTGRERQRGGLLSPFVLILVGTGCVAGSAAIFISDARNLGWFRLLGVACVCFSLALYRVRHGRERSAA
jgi:hypothetical protein